jgi:putative nucleotidyltransferase with HDIG domain
MISTQIDIEALLKAELPPLPGSALRVANLAQDMNASTRAVADAIGTDPVLAARVLRAANSPMYSSERRVTALPTAVHTLGNNTVHMLVIISVAADTMDQKNRRSPLAKIMWEHSMAVGVLARELSRELGMRGSEEAFLCGLLHDIGKILLLRHDAELYATTLGVENEYEALAREQEVYGFTHSQIGALVSKRWDLPEEISFAINFHHQPDNAGKSMLMARIVDVADQLANGSGIGLRTKQEINVAESESAIVLKLSDEQLLTVGTRSQASLAEVMTLFS